MNNTENKLYQQMAQYLRHRTDLGDPNHWPGKSRYAVAVTRYPNILAEVCATVGYPNIDLAAEFAGVSREIMAAVIEDNEELSQLELYMLASRWNRGSVEYLTSPHLQVITTRTNKGKARRRFLSDLLERTAGITDKSIDEYIRDDAELVLKYMNDEYVVSYARWRNACQGLERSLYWHNLEERRKNVRTARMATVQTVTVDAP